MREIVGGIPQTSLRARISELRAIGALAKRERRAMPYSVANELTPVGQGVLAAADSLETWLGRAPSGPIALGSEPAKGAIRALVGGWGPGIVHALAIRPHSLTELAEAVRGVSYPAIERRLSTMRAAGQVAVMPGRGGLGRPYVVTRWLREAVAPLAVAGSCECLYMGERTEPIAPMDVEAVFLLALPLLNLDAEGSWSCLLAVDTVRQGENSTRVSESKQRMAHVAVDIENGEVTPSRAVKVAKRGAWASGTVEEWFDAVANGRVERLRMGGAAAGRASRLLEALNAALFPTDMVPPESGTA